MKSYGNKKMLTGSVIALLVVIIIILSVFLGLAEDKKHRTPQPNSFTSEDFCNCFGSQYDGSAGEPNRNYYGLLPNCSTCIYSRPSVRKAYEEGKFLPEWSGV